MSAPSLQSFQDQVSELLLRHRSLLDVMSKLGQTNAAAVRSVTKAITECGCIELHATKQEFEPGLSLEEAKERIGRHVQGELCENCRDVISNELGRSLFYTSALCNLLGIQLEEVLEKESQKCSTLGLFNMS
ncbi:hypothetical protein J25TS5_53040 [Paenibacillus faecis]|uniref:DUF1573 domain-containing protein n=1 Tax=Paenibacillus faecis TaxID=862114 RepID=A0A5D0CIF7_9BACL|nr:MULTISPECIES: DUF1573 domain-containing protein [Paenibacillus]MCA1296167.1 DUF1573 domain-containing protein [Paenibacillus sp. alder61]TYA09843.1 DUF1573 domain-containing protein [Paenibacillus faecis]GIO88372.1 hypothetical protein J25TS5_53040 [Paenibacillus faecis]